MSEPPTRPDRQQIGRAGPEGEPAVEGHAVRDATWPQAALGGVTELRVHGVGGTPPADMLDALDPVQVSGDRTAGVWRGHDVPGPQSRHVEAYAWGGLTARAASRALWLLVLPFALVNVAGWMAPHRGASAFRGAVRVMGVVVTGLYVSFAAVAAMDFAAYQCGGASDRARASCSVDTWWLVGEGGVAHDPARRVVVGASVPLALLALLWWLTRQSRRAYERWGEPGSVDLPSSDGPAEDGLTHHGFWRGQGYAVRLAEIHLMVGLAVVAAPLGQTASVLSGSRAGAMVWWTGVATVTVGMALAAVTRLRRRLPAGAALGWGLGLTAVALLVAWFTATPPSPNDPAILPGLPLLFGFFIPTLLPGVLAVFATAYWHAGARQDPDRLRHALTPATVVQTAAMTTLAIQSGVVLWVARWLGDARAFHTGATRPDIEYAQAFEVLARAIPWALLILAASAGLAWASVARRGIDDAQTRADQAWSAIDRPRGWSDGRDDPSWRSSWRRAVTLPSGSLSALEWGLWVTASAGVLPTFVYWVLWTREKMRQNWTTDHIEVDVGWLTLLPVSLCTWLLTAIPLVAVFVLRHSLTHPRTRRTVAIAWDVATFWPRSFHPLAPPSYAERAVPELKARLQRLWRGDVDQDGQEHPGAVLLLGHSQGSVLVTAALAALPPDAPIPGRLSVVTYGCPVRRLYQRHFPAYFDDTLITTAVERLTPPSAGGEDGAAPPDALPAWRNAYRDTDYVGHRLLDPAAPLRGVDLYLPDPPAPFHPTGDPAPPTRAHAEGGYRRQSTLADIVAAEASRLHHALHAPQSPRTPHHLEQIHHGHNRLGQNHLEQDRSEGEPARRTSPI